MNSKELAFIYNSIIAPWGVGFDLTITPLFYQGVIAGSEFGIYNANKLYLLNRLSASAPGGGAVGYIYLYDETNTLFRVFANNCAYWNGTTLAPNYSYNDLIHKDMYFARVTQSGYSSITFIGYRIERV